MKRREVFKKRSLINRPLTAAALAVILAFSPMAGQTVRADDEAAAGEYSSWIQSFINRKRTRCNLTTYDCADYQTLAVRITFDGK